MSGLYSAAPSKRTDLPSVMFDTNVVLDVCLKREPYYHDSASAVFQMIALEQKSFISASSITDIYYMLHQSTHSAEATYELMDDVLDMFEIADITAMDIYGAHACGCKIPDFEDAVIAFAAERLGLKYVITRNLDDFKKLLVHAITPHEFLKVLDQKGSD